LKERLIRVVLQPLQNEAEVMETLRECYFGIGDAVERVKLVSSGSIIIKRGSVS